MAKATSDGRRSIKTVLKRTLKMRKPTESEVEKYGRVYVFEDADTGRVVMVAHGSDLYDREGHMFRECV